MEYGMKKMNKTSWLLLAVAGLIMVNLSVMAAWQPGLKAGYISSAWETNNYPSVVEGQLGPHGGATTSTSVWPENRTWVYTGKMYFDGSTYHFAENINNFAQMKIDGVTYIDDMEWYIPTKSGDVNLSAGWHDIEIRLGNGGGAGGPTSNNGWSLTKGFGYNIDGADSTNGVDYVYPEDDGSMNLFRWDDGFDGVVNDPATDITPSNAVFNGRLLTTNLNNLVSVFWGPTDGGTNAAAWTNRYDFAYPAAQGAYPTNVTIDTSDSLIFYRYYMSNDTLTAWADSTEIVLSGEVTVQAVDSDATEGVSGATGTFRFSRPSSATNAALAVNYSIDGTAVNGADYVALTGSVYIPEGESSVDVIVDPIEDNDMTEGDESVSLTLTAGNYIIGALSTDTMTLHDSGSLDQWAHRVPIVFNGYYGTEELTDFPALVQVSTNISGFSYSGLLSGDYDDLRFINDSQNMFLNYEVESWDADGTSQVWVQVPALTNSAVIWMVWGRSGITAPEYTTDGSAWSNGYVSVWHFAETSGTELKDSVGNYTGDVLGGLDLAQLGLIGSGGRFDGSDDAVLLGAMPKLAGNHNVTVTGWMNLDTLGSSNSDDSMLFSTAGSDNFLVWYNHSQHTSGDKVYSFNLGNTSIGTNRANTVSGIAKAQTWQHIGAVLDNSLRQLYVDGNIENVKTGDVSTVGSTSTAYLGAWNSSSSSYNHDGAMDEVRVSTASRSADWIEAEYLNAGSNSVFQVAPGTGPSLLVDGYPGPYGAPSPDNGITNLTSGEIITCTAPLIVDAGGGVGYECIGYSLYTNLVDLVATGTGNSCVYTNSGGADRLVWQWQTRYYVSFVASGSGTVSNPGGWYDMGTQVDCMASGIGGAAFVGWSGSVAMLSTPTVYAFTYLTVTGPATLTANFIPAFNPSGWSRQLAIDFDSYDRSETLTNFPMMVQLSDGLANCFYYSDMASPSDGGDLRFTAGDGVTELVYDIEKWETDGTSTIWVRLPELSTNNNQIFVYWGNPLETDPPDYVDSGITWANGFVAVYHLAENSGSVKDSSPYGNGLTVYNDINQGTNGIAGPAAGWPAYNGNDWLGRSSTDSLHGMGQLTLQTWFYDTKNDTFPRGLISKRSGGSGKDYYFFKYQDRRIWWYVGAAGGPFVNTETGADQWYFVAGTYDKNLATDRMKMYLDGEFKSARNDASGDVPSNDKTLTIGILDENYKSSDIPCCWEGKLDELRISAVARSADWIWTEYNNVKNHATFQRYYQPSGGTMIIVQ